MKPITSRSMTRTMTRMRKRLTTGTALGYASSAILLAAILLSTGCGFHLQNKAELPPEMALTYLEIKNPYSRLAQRVETLLEQNGADVVNSRENAAILEIPVNNLRKVIQSIGDNARVREYQVRLTVNFRLLNSNGEELMPMQVIELSRVYSFNEQDILAAEREDEYLRKEVSDTVASMVVRRIGTWSEPVTP